MHIGRIRLIVIGLVLVVSVGCASTQMLTVQTEPAGAQVYLQRRGDVEVEARIGPVFGKASVEAFEEEFQSLGTTPVEYEFDLKDDQGAIHAPEAGGAVTRRHKQGTIRIELEGHEVFERTVSFSGEPISLILSLKPVKDE